MLLNPFLRLREGTHKDDPERGEHIKSLRAIQQVTDFSNPYDFLYGNLTIVDSKASSLLTFNALGLAVVSVWLSNVPPNKFHFLMDIAFVALLLSCICSLRCVWLYWSETKHFDPEKMEDHLIELLGRRDNRTLFYRAAWMFSFAAVLIVLFATLIHSYGVAAQTFGFCGEECKSFYENENWGIPTTH